MASNSHSSRHRDLGVINFEHQWPGAADQHVIHDGKNMESIELNYSEKLIKDTVRKCWFRQIGPFFFVVLSALTIYAIYLIFSGDRTWYVGLIGTVVIIGAITIFASYIVQINRALTRLKRMEKPNAIFEYSENNFKVTSDIGSSEFKWSLISKIMCLDRAWVIYFSENETMTLPITNINEDSRAFILSKVRENKGKIV